MKLRWQENGYRQRISEKVSASCSTPAATKARRERAIAMRLNELGTEARTDLGDEDVVVPARADRRGKATSRNAIQRRGS